METIKIPLSIVIAVNLFSSIFISGLQGGDPVRIVIFGDSITAGYGLDPDRAFPARIQDRIDSLEWNAEVVNAGVSGETSAGGVRRIDWVLQRRPDLFVLELGGNDALRGVDPDETSRNLRQIIGRVRDRYPDTVIILAGMEAPPNMGEEYRDRFRNIFPELAEGHDTVLLPFILDGVGGVSDLNQPDGIHPTEEGHEIIAENLWEILRPLLEESLQQTGGQK